MKKILKKILKSNKLKLLVFILFFHSLNFSIGHAKLKLAMRLKFIKIYDV